MQSGFYFGNLRDFQLSICNEKAKSHTRGLKAALHCDKIINKSNNAENGVARRL